MWTEQPCKNFHLLICLAILDTEKTTLIENKFGFTEILKVSNVASPVVGAQGSILGSFIEGIGIKILMT